MATKNIVPRANGEGSLGTASKYWQSAYANSVTASKSMASSTDYPFVAENTNGAVNEAGGIAFKRQGDVRASIDAHYYNGLSFKTKNDNGSLEERFRIDDAGTSVFYSSAEVRNGSYLMLRPSANDFDWRCVAVGTELHTYAGNDLVNPHVRYKEDGNTFYKKSLYLSANDAAIRTLDETAFIIPKNTSGDYWQRSPGAAYHDASAHVFRSGTGVSGATILGDGTIRVENTASGGNSTNFLKLAYGGSSGYADIGPDSLGGGTNLRLGASYNGVYATVATFGCDKSVYLYNAVSAPSSSNSGGVIIYSSGGALYCRGAAGTITQLAIS
ncbi:MAG: hypothetical protein ACNI26_15175 [Terasakiella sp.]|uniref:hypothetical protein n=1 Tax=unclassified Terasakiella TaxID=2614952 RepID=UPI003B0095E8